MTALREQLLAACQTLDELGLNRGTSGNVSLRATNAAGEAGFLITPSGVAVTDLQIDDLVWMDFTGHVAGTKAPSSEWRFHHAILQARAEVQAVVHTHSTFATAYSSFRTVLPAFHYMVAVAGGHDVRCAPYALFGSQALSDAALIALYERYACLLANHGLIALGKNIAQAIYIANEVETLCKQYVHALQIGQPHILSVEDMDAVLTQFQGYGRWQAKP